MASQFLNASRAARSVDISEDRIAALVEQGVLEGFRNGGVTFVTRDSLDVWHANQKPRNGETSMSDTKKIDAKTAPERRLAKRGPNWTTDENRILTTEYTGKRSSFAVIAKKLGRTTNGCEVHLGKLRREAREAQRDAQRAALVPDVIPVIAPPVDNGRVDCVETLLAAPAPDIPPTRRLVIDYVVEGAGASADLTETILLKNIRRQRVLIDTPYGIATARVLETRMGSA